MPTKYWVNRETGEVTESHKEAMDWYRSGYGVDVYRNGRCILSLKF